MIAGPQKRNWRSGTTASETRWGKALSREVHDIPAPYRVRKKDIVSGLGVPLIKNSGVKIGTMKGFFCCQRPGLALGTVV